MNTKRNLLSDIVHFVIDGKKFRSAKEVHCICVARGFNGSHGVTRARLSKGANTWTELCAPVGRSMDRAQATKSAHRAEEKSLMAQLCAELDARRAALKVAA